MGLAFREATCLSVWHQKVFWKSFHRFWSVYPIPYRNVLVWILSSPQISHSAVCILNSYLHFHLSNEWIGDWAGNSYATSGCPGTCEERLMEPTNFEVRLLLEFWWSTRQTCPRRMPLGALIPSMFIESRRLLAVFLLVHQCIHLITGFISGYRCTWQYLPPFFLCNIWMYLSKITISSSTSTSPGQHHHEYAAPRNSLLEGLHSPIHDATPIRLIQWEG